VEHDFARSGRSRARLSQGWCNAMNAAIAEGMRARSSAIADTIAAYDRVALVLQGGGALGAYQVGVYEALAEAGGEPNWLSGVSIGAVNAAIIAGNRPENRLQRLSEFW